MNKLLAPSTAVLALSLVSPSAVAEQHHPVYEKDLTAPSAELAARHSGIHEKIKQLLHQLHVADNAGCRAMLDLTHLTAIAPPEIRNEIHVHADRVHELALTTLALEKLGTDTKEAQQHWKAESDALYSGRIEPLVPDHTIEFIGYLEEHGNAGNACREAIEHAGVQTAAHEN